MDTLLPYKMYFSEQTFAPSDVEAMSLMKADEYCNTNKSSQAQQNPA